jgi:hypothetical protein
MGTTRKGRSHLCFRPHPNFIKSLSGEENKYRINIESGLFNFN